MKWAGTSPSSRPATWRAWGAWSIRAAAAKAAGRGEEIYCDNNEVVVTYNGRHKDGTPTYGGYSDRIVVTEGFALKVSPKLDLADVAPLLCAGITTYSPLRHWKVGPGSRMGVVGLGGLGHMALKFGHACDARVFQFSTSPGKVDDAKGWAPTR